MTGNVVRIGAVADVHYGRDAEKRLRAVFEEAARRVDVLLLAGDLTDFGLPEEAQVLARDLTEVVRIPIVAVLGNHDYEAGKEQEVTAVLRKAGIRVLDGDAVEVKGVGIVGVKGFGGGFGRGTLEPWGEAGVKRFVHEAVEEGLKLERALARLHTPVRVALLHYAPVRDTVIGEPEEIFAFLGCGRLEEPLNRYGVNAVFHGHAHGGSPEGRTSSGIPVYNVALPVLRQVVPNGLPLKVIELPVGEPTHAV
ncbi:MAG TPA: metallophosphoesterase [Gemmataceae bacterium]|nr:metallophosphoesterase [Gemmataceae bacterium]